MPATKSRTKQEEADKSIKAERSRVAENIIDDRLNAAGGSARQLVEALALAGLDEAFACVAIAENHLMAARQSISAVLPDVPPF
jgi:adenine/guanine phosphoribosyltransferase-like PRPP-binding protein